MPFKVMEVLKLENVLKVHLFILQEQKNKAWSVYGAGGVETKHIVEKTQIKFRGF